MGPIVSVSERATLLSEMRQGYGKDIWLRTRDPVADGIVMRDPTCMSHDNR